MKNVYIPIILALFIAPAIAGVSSAAPAKAASAAETFIEKVGEHALGIIQNTALTEKEKERELILLFNESMDAPWIGKFVLGRYWRQLDEQAQKHYLSLYNQFLIISYVPKFRQYTNEKFKIKSIRNGKEGEYLVETDIIRPGNAPINVQYWVRNGENGSYKIFDVIGEGVSLIHTQRSEFSSVISRNGLDSFIKRLEARVNK